MEGRPVDVGDYLEVVVVEVGCSLRRRLLNEPEVQGCALIGSADLLVLVVLSASFLPSAPSSWSSAGSCAVVALGQRWHLLFIVEL